MKINDSIGLSQNRLPIAKTNTSLLSGIPKHQNKLNIILVSILYVSNSKLHSRLTDTEAHSAEVATTVATATYRIGLPQVFFVGPRFHSMHQLPYIFTMSAQNNGRQVCCELH